MATVALLEKTSEADAASRRSKALDGNICRCGTFMRIMEAALTAKGVTRG